MIYVSFYIEVIVYVFPLTLNSHMQVFVADSTSETVRGTMQENHWDCMGCLDIE